jgi:rRNA-processing protein FCF1
MKKILVDTNFLLSQFEFGVDVPTELQRVVAEPLVLLLPSVVLDEIRMFAGKTGRKALAARFVLQNMEKMKTRFAIELVESRGSADAWIIKFALKNSVTVATNDISLRKRLLSLGVPVIAVKGKSKLDYM